VGVERHRQERAVMEAEAWRLRVSGWTQARIAEKLGMTQQNVSKILSAIERKLYAEFITEVEEMKAQQSLRLDHLYDRLSAEFERQVEDGAVNPALLAQAMKALEGQRAIWGLDAPKRQEVSGPGGAPIAITEVRVHLAKEEDG
jgi:DNA-binding CsgD family transcriptional regulator